MIDLHTHTIHSDGLQTVDELLEKAQTAGVDIISITDHDSVEAYKELVAPGKLKIIKGVELPFKRHNIINEVLGYGIDTDKISTFLGELCVNKKRDETRNLIRLYKKMVRMGYTLSPLGVLIWTLKCSNIRAAGVIRDDIVKFAENESLNGKYNFAPYGKLYDDHFNNPNHSFYFKSKNRHPSIKEVSRAIRSSGGLCFMAHIFKLSEEKAKKILAYCVKRRLLDGVEVYHPCHSAEQIEFLLGFARSHKLLISGGTDNHKVSTKLGIENINMEWVSQL